MVVPTLTSAAGVVSLLEEPTKEVKVYALKQLDQLVHSFWPELSDHLSKIEILYEDESFPARELAALVASKIYYHLGEFDDSVTFALGAGSLFNVADRTEYVDTIVAKCIDKYIALREANYQVDAAPGKDSVDVRLRSVVERMFKKCFDDKEFRQAIGVALECRRLDIVDSAIKQGEPAELLQYTLDVSTTLVQNIGFRNKTLELLVSLYQGLKEPDFIAVSQCLLWLDDAQAMANVLMKLAQGSEDHVLLAYQIAFDSYGNAKQEFIQKLLKLLPQQDSAMDTDDSTFSTSVISNVIRILSGKLTTELQLEFLYRNNKCDLLILKNTKTALDGRSSMYHSAVSFANAFMNAGTTSDQFLRDSMDWMARASNWTKFTATAQLGVIHRGNVANSMNLLRPYLPQDGVSSSIYSEGGSLFALGLIHANHGSAVLDYLKTQLKNTQDQVIQHGACLGLGVAGMATFDEEIYENLKNTLFGDNAIAGEAAGLAMGLVMLGSANSKAVEEMIQYAHETQHEKIIRGLALGIALVMYGQEDNAEVLIARLSDDKDPILRYSGVFTIALAYCGTSNNKAIRRLLHIAVSDANDDVRRVAVMALGFVLLRNPHQVPRIVQLLAESYNPHVRQGAAMALGVSCAGTGMPEALTLIDALSKDPVDFVRQGSYVAAAMILVQHNDVSNPKAGEYRKQFEKVITAKHEDAMARFGAVLAQGIIDAGGRNATIALASNGNVNMMGVVGMTLFSQFWYWFPFAHFLSLAFTPTALIGLNKGLKIPKFEFVSNAKPSLFAYPPATKPPTTEKVEKVATAVLSTTAKAKSRAKKAEKEKGGSNMEMDEKKDSAATEDVEMKTEPAAAAIATATATTTEDETKKEEEETKKKEKEAGFEVLQNLSRVIPQQVARLSFRDDSRYVPIKKGPVSGIVLMKDRKPSEAEELIEFSTPKVAGAGSEEQEPEAPQPFEYVE